MINPQPTSKPAKKKRKAPGLKPKPGEPLPQTKASKLADETGQALVLNVPIKRGRPTKYKPIYCDMVQESAARGESLYEFAASIGIARVTIEDWSKLHLEFANAVARAKTINQSWWEQKGRESLPERNFQSSVWKAITAARFKHDYGNQGDVVTHQLADPLMELLQRVSDNGRRIYRSAHTRPEIDCEAEDAEETVGTRQIEGLRGSD